MRLKLRAYAILNDVAKIGLAKVGLTELLATAMC